MKSTALVDDKVVCKHRTNLLAMHISFYIETTTTYHWYVRTNKSSVLNRSERATNSNYTSCPNVTHYVSHHIFDVTVRNPQMGDCGPCVCLYHILLRNYASFLRIHDTWVRNKWVHASRKFTNPCATFMHL